MKRASGFCAMRPLMSAICLDCWLLASVTVSCTPSLAACSFMLAVSARRQGLLLAFWLNATLKPDCLVSLGALSAVGTPDGGLEFPGSAAFVRGQELDPPPDAEVPELSLPPQATSMPAESTAMPANETILVRCTSPPGVAASPALQRRELVVPIPTPPKRVCTTTHVTGP